jgi:hypothetical protein
LHIFFLIAVFGILESYIRAHCLDVGDGLKKDTLASCDTSAREKLQYYWGNVQDAGRYDHGSTRLSFDLLIFRFNYLIRYELCMLPHYPQVAGYIVS